MERSLNFRFLSAAVVSVIVFGMMIFHWPESLIFLVDDTYIHLVYAKNFLQTGEFAFNQGVTSFGVTSVSWPVMIAILGKMGISLEVATLLLSFGFFTLALVAIAGVSFGHYPLHKRLFMSALLALVMSSNGFVLWHLFSGMETVFYTSMALLTSVAFAAGHRPLTWVFLSMMIMTRINAIDMCLLLLFLSWVQEGHLNLRVLPRKILFILSAFIPYTVVQKALGLSFVPSSGSAKLTTYVNGVNSLQYVYEYVLSFVNFLPGLLAACVVIVMLLPLVFRKRRNLLLAGRNNWLLVFSLWALGDTLAYVLFYRSMSVQSYRYHFSALVIVPLFLCYAMGLTYKLGMRKIPIVICVIGLFAYSYDTKPWLQIIEMNRAHLSAVYVDAAKFISRTAKKGARVATFDVGAAKYFNDDVEIVDIGGINLPEIHPYLERRRIDEYLSKYPVDYVMIFRQPNTDLITRIHHSLFELKYRLQIRRINTFAVDPYPLPQVLHSRFLDIYKVENQWVDCKGKEEECFQSSARPYSDDKKPLADYWGMHLIESAVRPQVVNSIDFYWESPYVYIENTWHKTHKEPIDTWYTIRFHHLESKTDYFSQKRAIGGGLMQQKYFKTDQAYTYENLMPLSRVMPHGKYEVYLEIQDLSNKIGEFEYVNPYGKGDSHGFAFAKRRAEQRIVDTIQWVESNAQYVFCKSKSLLSYAKQNEFSWQAKNLEIMIDQIENRTFKRLGVEKVPTCPEDNLPLQGIEDVDWYSIVNQGELGLFFPGMARILCLDPKIEEFAKLKVKIKQATLDLRCEETFD